MTSTPIGSIILLNKIEYQMSQFSLPAGVDVDAHYNSKHTNTMNRQFQQEFNQSNDTDNDHLLNTIFLIEDRSSTVSSSIDSFTHS